jgi:hypothetical protein
VKREKEREMIEGGKMGEREERERERMSAAHGER